LQSKRGVYNKNLIRKYLILPSVQEGNLRLTTENTIKLKYCADFIRIFCGQARLEILCVRRAAVWNLREKVLGGFAPEEVHKTAQNPTKNGTKKAAQSRPSSRMCQCYISKN
jgi:hypothetical protein